MWFPELDTAIFVIDPATEMLTLPLSNGQTGLITDEGNQPTLHIHQSCQEDLVEEELNPSTYWDADGLLTVERQ